MNNRKPLLLLVGIIAGIASFRVYEVSGLASAIASLLISGWILVNLTTAKGIVGGLASLMEPSKTSVNFLLLGFLYGSLEGFGFWGSVGTGLAGFMLGAFIAMWFDKYWNIGG